MDAKQDWMPHKQGSSSRIHSPSTAIHTYRQHAQQKAIVCIRLNGAASEVTGW